MTVTIAIVDTTFASVNMGALCERAIRNLTGGVRVVRSTVPGIKDLAVACRRHLDAGADLAIALGMPGPEPVDKQSAHVASTGLQFAQVLTGKHIVEVFVHADEARDARELHEVVENRTVEHAENAVNLLLHPDRLLRQAGTGQRQGFQDVGGIAEGAKAPERAAKEAGTYTPAGGGGGSTGGRGH